ncbi:MAG: hypothetical protein O3B86_14645, partial [Planctomycetota bacterium]|nr:hypothetical protein [Planctomycetota bacterium]
ILSVENVAEGDTLDGGDRFNWQSIRDARDRLRATLATIEHLAAVIHPSDQRRFEEFLKYVSSLYHLDSGSPAVLPQNDQLRQSFRSLFRALPEPSAASKATGDDAAAKPAEADRLPNEKGFVKAPSDPSAYVPQAEILAEHTPLNLGLEPKDLVKITEEFSINAVKWTRPRSNRRSIHLVDWTTFIRRLRSTETDGTPAVFPEEKETRQAAIRAKKTKKN